MSSPQTVTDLLDMRMRVHPDRTAFTFISGSSSAPACLSFASLASEARRIASELITLNVHRRPVLLLYPAGLEYLSAFFGCLYAGAIAVPFLPPRSNRKLRRLESVLKDAEPSLALSVSHMVSKLQPAVLDQLGNA